MYGGFAGWEDCLDERDLHANVTILCGDLLGDDDFTAEPLSDCCDPTVPVTCSDAGCRAAVIAKDPSCAERWRPNCSNLAFGICCQLCRPTRCDNANNVLRATEPGSYPLLDGLTLTGAEANRLGYYFYGFLGALYASQANPTVSRCTFTRNWGGTSGIYAWHGSPVVKNTLFIGNYGTGFEMVSPPAEFTVRGTSFIDNGGAGLITTNADATITDCKFVGNSSGLYCFSSNCTVVGSQFVGNDGHGMYGHGYTQVIDSLFQGNSASGLFISGFALIVNSVFAGNTGSLGAGVNAGFGGVYVLNSVFFGNTANGAGGMWVGDGGATIRNSIFWGNSDQGGLTQSAQFSTYSTSIIHVDHSIVQAWTGSWGGVGNSGVYPMFVNPLGPDGIIGTEDDDLRLLPGSPAINAGDPDTSFLPTTDLDGHARVLCDRVDIGAYEFGIGDFNCDQSVDLLDFANWPACMTGPSTADTAVPQGCEPFDFDGDDDIDLLDFAAFQRAFIGP